MAFRWLFAMAYRWLLRWLFAMAFSRWLSVVVCYGCRLLFAVAFRDGFFDGFRDGLAFEQWLGSFAVAWLFSNGLAFLQWLGFSSDGFGSCNRDGVVVAMAWLRAMALALALVVAMVL